jgi:hypothetical protein
VVLLCLLACQLGLVAVNLSFVGCYGKWHEWLKPHQHSVLLLLFPNAITSGGMWADFQRTLAAWAEGFQCEVVSSSLHYLILFTGFTPHLFLFHVTLMPKANPLSVRNCIYLLLEIWPQVAETHNGWADRVPALSVIKSQCWSRAACLLVCACRIAHRDASTLALDRGIVFACLMGLLQEWNQIRYEVLYEYLMLLLVCFPIWETNLHFEQNFLCPDPNNNVNRKNFRYPAGQY